MAQGIRVGIVGAGWPGVAHARGYREAGGFTVTAVADLIPQRREQMIKEFGIKKQYASAEELLADADIDAVSVCLPNHLHTPVTVAAMKAGKHVICESPPALAAAEARQMARAAAKYQKVLLYGLQRRFGPHVQAARAAVANGYAGDVYHVRAAWTRTRGIPLGTGWFTRKETAGGGALIDTGLQMLDIAWFLLGQPRPLSVFGMTHSRFASTVPAGTSYDVDDSAFALVRFENGKSLELATSWAINQPQLHNGTTLRLHGDKGAIDVHTVHGAILYSDFDDHGICKENPLKPPKVANHKALMRHFAQCISGKAAPLCGPDEGVALMEMIEAIYRSAQSGRSVALSNGRGAIANGAGAADNAGVAAPG